MFPDTLEPPDETLDFYEFDEFLSHTILIWNNDDNEFGLNLRPFFDIVKVCFVISKWTEIYSIHEVHIQVLPTGLDTDWLM